MIIAMKSECEFFFIRQDEGEENDDEQKPIVNEEKRKGNKWTNMECSRLPCHLFPVKKKHVVINETT